MALKDIKPCGCPGCSLALILEAERQDLSWRIGRDKASGENPRRRLGNRQDKRDQIMFHAGRYAMGARDTAAVKANQEFKSLLGLD